MMFTARDLLLPVFLTVTLVGCHSIPRTVTPQTTALNTAAPAKPANTASTVSSATTTAAANSQNQGSKTQNTLQSFKITGKIGVRTPKQNGSAFYGWSQNGDHFAIDLTGALGIGQTTIRGQSGDVTLVSSKTGTLHATSPEQLLEKATGWQAPITHLISWINAQPAEKNAQTQKDSTGRITQIIENGWTAQLHYQNAEKLPNKLVIVDDAQQNRVILTIQSRE